MLKLSVFSFLSLSLFSQTAIAEMEIYTYPPFVDIEFETEVPDVGDISGDVLIFPFGVDGSCAFVSEDGCLTADVDFVASLTTGNIDITYEYASVTGGAFSCNADGSYEYSGWIDYTSGGTNFSADFSIVNGAISGGAGLDFTCDGGDVISCNIRSATDGSVIGSFTYSNDSFACSVLTDFEDAVGLEATYETNLGDVIFQTGCVNGEFGGATCLFSPENPLEILPLPGIFETEDGTDDSGFFE